MPIRWLRTALRNLDHANYIAKDDPDAARRAVERVRAAVSQLTQYPSMGRIGRVVGTRELIIDGTPWIVHPVRSADIEMIRILHDPAVMRHVVPPRSSHAISQPISQVRGRQHEGRGIGYSRV